MMMKKLFFSLFIIFLTGAVILAAPTDSFAKKKKASLEDLPPLVGPKKTIAVMAFENKAGAAAEWSLGEGMAEMLTTALVNSGRFIVVERQAIRDVLDEQDFGASGRTTQFGAARFGKVLNAQILVRGAVTEFGMKESGGGHALSIKGFDIGLSGSQAHVAVNMRLYDTTTGQVIDSVRCDGKASAGGIDFGYSESDWGFGTGAFYNTPIGKATQKAIDKAVYFVAMKMRDVEWEGRIIKASKGEVYINAGATSGIKVGDTFSVYRPGEELIDPQTGLSLGCEITKIGRVTVTTAAEKFSKASVGLGSGFKTNDIVKFE